MAILIRKRCPHFAVHFGTHTAKHQQGSFIVDLILMPMSLAGSSWTNLGVSVYLLHVVVLEDEKEMSSRLTVCPRLSTWMQQISKSVVILVRMLWLSIGAKGALLQDVRIESSQNFLACTSCQTNETECEIPCRAIQDLIDTRNTGNGI